MYLIFPRHLAIKNVKNLYMCIEYCLYFLVVFDLHVVIHCNYIPIYNNFFLLYIFFSLLKYIIKVLGSMPHKVMRKVCIIGTLSIQYIYFCKTALWPYSEINPHFGVVIKCTLRQLTYDGIHAGRYFCF